MGSGPRHGFGKGWDQTYESEGAKIAEKGDVSVAVERGFASVYDAQADVEVHVPDGGAGMTPEDAANLLDLASSN